METLTCDLLVVGAGPGGSAAALAAAKAGLKVVVVEQRQVIGLPVQCAEYVPAPLIGSLGLGNGYVVQPVKAMKTILPGGQETLTKTPGYIIRRDLFDQTIAKAAQEHGATYLLSHRAQALTVDKSILLGKKGGGVRKVQSKVIIGADGPRSTVGRWIGVTNRNLLPGAQVTMALTRPLEQTEIYFEPSIFAGYAWLFPKGSLANVGLGYRRGGKGVGQDSLSELLENFVARRKAEGRVKGDPVRSTAGWIPAEPVRNAVHDQVMLVGDAAGQTHPITGAGIYTAVSCGELAGQWAAKAVQENDLSLLAGYDEEWRDLFEHSQERAMSRRRLMEERWDDFGEILPKCWVAFREYYAAP